ncbi:MAG: ABC transporter permease [Spirochaetaceae bacterium]|nr:MAG: ABC transporter permease [Spirochaetaceae bacterium]
MKPRIATAARVVLWCTLLYIGTLALVAIAAPLIAPADPLVQNIPARFSSPGTAGYPLGADDFGRDVLSRIIFGARAALLVGLVSVGIALLLGLVTGLAAGLLEGPVDSALMLLMDAVLSFPTVLLAITVVSVFGYGLPQVMAAIGVIFSPLFARIVRAETLTLKQEPYVMSAHALGTPLRRIVSVHLLPNMLPKIVVQCTVTFALAIVIEASLSFLGLGAQPPQPSWGLMLRSARNYLLDAPWLAFYPGLAIGLTVFSFNLLGDLLNELLQIRR